MKTTWFWLRPAAVAAALLACASTPAYGEGVARPSAETQPRPPDLAAGRIESFSRILRQAPRPFGALKRAAWWDAVVHRLPPGLMAERVRELHPELALILDADGIRHSRVFGELLMQRLFLELEDASSDVRPAYVKAMFGVVLSVPITPETRPWLVEITAYLLKQGDQKAMVLDELAGNVEVLEPAPALVDLVLAQVTTVPATAQELQISLQALDLLGLDVHLLNRDQVTTLAAFRNELRALRGHAPAAELARAIGVFVAGVRETEVVLDTFRVPARVLNQEQTWLARAFLKIVADPDGAAGPSKRAGWWRRVASNLPKRLKGLPIIATSATVRPLFGNGAVRSDDSFGDLLIRQIFAEIDAYPPRQKGRQVFLRDMTEAALALPRDRRMVRALTKHLDGLLDDGYTRQATLEAIAARPGILRDAKSLFDRTVHYAVHLPRNARGHRTNLLALRALTEVPDLIEAQHLADVAAIGRKLERTDLSPERLDEVVATFGTFITALNSLHEPWCEADLKE